MRNDGPASLLGVLTLSNGTELIVRPVLFIPLIIKNITKVLLCLQEWFTQSERRIILETSFDQGQLCRPHISHRTAAIPDRNNC
jgi:hypothetical protein